MQLWLLRLLADAPSTTVATRKLVESRLHTINTSRNRFRLVGSNQAKSLIPFPTCFSQDRLFIWSMPLDWNHAQGLLYCQLLLGFANQQSTRLLHRIRRALPSCLDHRVCRELSSCLVPRVQRTLPMAWTIVFVGGYPCAWYPEFDTHC